MAVPLPFVNLFLIRNEFSLIHLITLLVSFLVCILHAVFRPPVSRALASRYGDNESMESSLLNMEGGSSFHRSGDEDAYDLPANANIRLRSRPLPNANYSSRPPPPSHGM